MIEAQCPIADRIVAILVGLAYLAGFGTCAGVVAWWRR